MRTMQQLEGLEFDDKRACASPLFVDKAGRVLVLRTAPRPEPQGTRSAQLAPVLLVVKGEGMFARR